MNEITRIHIAKTAYEIEIAAKKLLEKYIKNLEQYTKDKEVLEDIEIRITELLAERGVKAGGVISSDDVSAIRKQLGEPYEFADDEGDMAVGPDPIDAGRRLYRSTDNAVLGGILSGIAAYFNVNPLWTRLVFILLLFISFGTAIFVYILFWILIPPARTATEKLQLVGKNVTVASIKELNADEDAATPNRVAPVLQQVFAIGFGVLSALAALGVFVTIISLVIGAVTFNSDVMEAANNFVGLGPEYAWLVWLLFWVGIFGLALLTALFVLVAYAFFAKKLTKKMIIAGIAIIILGVLSAASVIGVGSTQSLRVANESRSMVRDTTTNLPPTFSSVTSATFKVVGEKTNANQEAFGHYGVIRYVVDNGPVRYQLNALRTAKTAVVVEGTSAKITLTIPDSFRNSFVQPVLTVYGPALNELTVDGDSRFTEISYAGTTQDELKVNAADRLMTTISGTYNKVKVSGAGTVNLGESAVALLDVESKQNLHVNAGTVRELVVAQPDVCASGVYSDSASVSVSGVTSGKFIYNGQAKEAVTYKTNCASVIIEDQTDNEMY